ncbi:MAG: hypothetical protein QXM92_01995 [Candidatus Anstonellales archaeon]
MSEVANEKRRRRKGKKKYIFSEAEKKLLSFFVKEKKSEVSFCQLRKYCIVDLDMSLLDFHKVYILLLEKGVLVESVTPNHDNIYSILIDIPAIVKDYLNLKYYDSAIILAALFKLFFYHMRKGIECEFSLWTLIHLKFYDIKQRYEDNNAIFRQSIHELIEKNYLKLISNKNYILNYKAVPDEVVSFLLLN